MAENQTNKIFANIERNIRSYVKERGMSILDLVTEIEMTEPGFYKMLQNESMKIKTLARVAEVLQEPVVVFFHGYDNVKASENMAFGVQATNYETERDLLKEQIDILKNTINDKNLIIDLLSKTK